jgi:beta-1,4-mannooligosaccharide/beta-1,4-mannosyl-N-acetylglucosamine phosphorylase
MEKERKQASIPWEECPKGCHDPVWRYSKNPVISRDVRADLCRVFNSALVPFEGGFAGVFRAEGRTGVPHLYVGKSKDGLHIDFAEKPICFMDEHGQEVKTYYSYDPRVVEIEGTYYVIWCDDFFGPALSIAKTADFVHFVKYDHPFLPFNRNGVLFPEKIDGKYLMLSRPSDSGHTAFGDIFLSKSTDMEHWGENAHVMERGWEWWNLTKIGAGPTPIKTKEGWLLLFHGVTNTCNGFVYSFGGALLDLKDPAKVLYRAADYLLTPEMDYETRGFVPNVVFPTSCLIDQKTGHMAIYYGASDTVTALCFSTIDTLVSFIKEHKR